MAGAEVGAWVGAEVGVWVGAEAGVWVGVTPIPSLATSPGCQGGGQYPMPVNMEPLCHIGDTVIHPMVPTIHLIHLTDGSSH